MSNNLYRTLRGNATNRVLGTIPCSLVDLHGAGFFKVLYLRFRNKGLDHLRVFFFFFDKFDYLQVLSIHIQEEYIFGLETSRALYNLIW